VVDEVGVVKAFRETGYGAGLVEICDLVELAVFGQCFDAIAAEVVFVGKDFFVVIFVKRRRGVLEMDFLIITLGRREGIEFVVR